MTANDAFYSYYATESLSQVTLDRFAATKTAILRAADHFGMHPGPWKVADIGCGAGTQCAMWARDGHRVFGIDINEPLVELGKQRAQQAGLPIEFSVGSATALPWPDACMDICICPELLEHVSDWQACLLETVRILKPRGILYLSTTNKLCPSQAEFDLPAYSWYPARLKRHYEKLAVTTRPQLANHAKYPAVNWFSYFELRDYLAKLGFRCMDRFDLAAVHCTGTSSRLLLQAIQALPPLRWLAHIGTPYTVVFAQKL